MRLHKKRLSFLRALLIFVVASDSAAVFGQDIEDLKFRAAHNGRGISETIQNYGIQDQDTLVEIAKLAAAQDGGGTSEYIQNYGIQDQDALIKIAKIAAAQNLWRASEYIQNYGIQNQAVLIEIAKLAAAKAGSDISKHIQNYGIQDQEVLIEIAKLAAAQERFGTSQYIQNYGIQDQVALIEIAKLAAQSGYGTSEFIQNYGIQDQAVLIEIAKLAAAQDGGGTSEYIQNYEIQDQAALIKIAKIAAGKAGGGTSEYIQNYGIQDQDALIEIATFAAAQDGGGTSEYIQNYGIQDQLALVGIAKFAVLRDTRGTSEYIQNYGIQDQDALIEIAKLAAAQDGGGTSKYIQNYGIQDQAVLIEIAKLAAAQDGGGTSKYIQNYGIQDQAVLIEIAKLAAAQDGGGTSEYIQNYGIQNQAVLIEIATIAAGKDGGGTSRYIQNYGIQDQAVLIEIAKLAAAQNGRGTSQYIQNYGIQDQDALIEIATRVFNQIRDGKLSQIAPHQAAAEEDLEAARVRGDTPLIHFMRLSPTAVDLASRREKLAKIFAQTEPAAAFPDFRERTPAWRLALGFQRLWSQYRVGALSPSEMESAVKTALTEEGSRELLMVSDDGRWSSSNIYAQLYFIRLVDALKTKGRASDELLGVRAAVADSLQKAMVHETGLSGLSGSAMNTYAFMASFWALKNDTHQEGLRNFLIEKQKSWDDPYGVPYNLFRNIRTRRAAVARTPLVYLGLFYGETSPEKKTQWREHLKVSLRNYVEAATDLVVHIPRDSTHEGRDGLAPYYFYPTLPYVAEAYQQLLEDGHTDPHEQEALLQQVIFLDDLLQSLYEEGQGFLLPGSQTYPAGRVWSTSLAAEASILLGEIRQKYEGRGKEESETATVDTILQRLQDLGSNENGLSGNLCPNP